MNTFLLRVKLLFVFSFSLLQLNAQEAIQSPSEFLGYELGTRFTENHQLLAYFDYVTANTNNSVMEEYGKTYEHRSLRLYFVSSAENISNLEDLRHANLVLSGIEEGEKKDNKAIVWLSYNVHGNESSSSEAAMATLFELVKKGNDSIQTWLDNTIVIIDPCVNPDGRDRYVHWYNQFRNKNYNPDPQSTEHYEPWPGGRQNHYLFDLNRDWAWQTQIESEARIKVYNKWMPHVHVDFHEQFINNPYYFAPAAEPFHEVISDWQREFQTTIGKNHAKYFDSNGWLYFTKESFDLLYPSYGDSYPTFNGAIGMTYEQAGHGFAGLGVITHEEDTLTLVDRIEHHKITSLSTIEATSLNADKVIAEFEKYFADSKKEPKGKYKSYIIKGDNEKDKLVRLSEFLDKQGIIYGRNTSGKSVKAFDYINDKEVSVNIESEDMIISSFQAKSNLLKTLFEPETKLSDSVTYDITAWSTPYSWGLEAYASVVEISAEEDFKVEMNSSLDSTGSKTYAYVSKWNSIDDVKAISFLLQKKVKLRFATEDFEIEGELYKAGSTIITQRGNEKLGKKFHEYIKEASEKYKRKYTPVSSGFVSKGKDFGSYSVKYLKAPKVAVLTGDKVSVTAYGEVWYYFEQIIDYPFTALNTEYLSYFDINEYDVLIIPNGYYSSILKSDVIEEIQNWVSNGGRLVLMESALRSFVDKEGFNLKKFATEKEKKALEKEEKEKEKDFLKSYKDRDRSDVSEVIYGSIFKTRMDLSHPLAFGYNEAYFTLKRSTRRYGYLTNGWNVSVIESKDALVSGFAGYEAIDKMNKSLVFGVQDMGSGAVIYMVDNPLFRAFWENGKMLFSNSVFLVGQ